MALIGRPITESQWWHQEALATAAPGFTDADHPRLTPTLGYSWPAAVCEKLDWLLVRGLYVVDGADGRNSCSVGSGDESDHKWLMAQLAKA